MVLKSLKTGSSMSKPVSIPRIRGNVLEEKKGVFTWVGFITIGGSDEEIHFSSPDGVSFINFDSALADLKKVSQEMADVISEKVYGNKPTGYLDLIKNQMVEKLT